MSKFLIVSLFSFTVCFVAQATPSYWVAAESAAATGDTSGGTAASSYSGYYCTAATAATLFGGASDIDTVTTYLVGNFGLAQALLQTESAKYKGGAGAAGQLRDVSYANGQYEFATTYGDALVGSAYLAMLFYQNGDDQQVRVMMNDVSGYDMTQGNVAFNDRSGATSGTFGDWTAAVPEPTSALLLILGMAGLALKRKRV